MNVIAVSEKSNRCNTNTMKLMKTGLFEEFKESGSVLLIAAMFVMGTIFALANQIPVKQVMGNYSYDVLVILMVMELFTNLIAETGIMQLLAIKIAGLSQGRKRLCLVMFGGMMFLISACLNNITAVMLILPIMFVLLKSLEIDKRYIHIFFSVILALSNTGGASSPVGDFPAIVIMTSGITSFVSYLTHAFPLFAITSLVLLVVWGMCVKKEKDDGGIRTLAVTNLKSQYKNIEIKTDVLKCLGIVFAAMFLAWSFVPQEMLPPEMVAILGYGLAMTICSLKGVKVEQRMDLKSVLTIASFLFFAEVVNQTGILSMLASYLEANIASPKILVMVIMVITSLVAGIFSAGPAAAAMMPVIVQICSGPLSNQADWIAVAYAAAICAGSSLFMWSATAGFILSSKVNAEDIVEESGEKVEFGIGQYLKFGFVNYFIQISIALLAMTIIL